MKKLGLILVLAGGLASVVMIVKVSADLLHNVSTLGVDMIIAIVCFICFALGFKIYMENYDK